MTKFNLDYKRIPHKGKTINSLSVKNFESFNKDILGLDNISMDGKYVNALSAFLDLQGFTKFCNQIDSNLVIPEFLSRYCDWIFQELGNQFVESKDSELVKIWGSLPFYAKFLGDGILFLWNTDISGKMPGMCNIVSNLIELTENYKTNFLPEIRKHVSNPPEVLRCGIARGQIISIGDGKDFVGSSINLSARLQKLGPLTFALSRRGFDESKSDNHSVFKILELKKTTIRGIGDEELIYVKKAEYSKLSKEDKSLFKDI